MYLAPYELISYVIANHDPLSASVEMRANLTLVAPPGADIDRDLNSWLLRMRCTLPANNVTFIRVTHSRESGPNARSK